jgi:hypothetical protein
MKPLGRRIAYVGIVLLWLAIMCLPIFAFVLATQGQVQVGNSFRLRVFLLQDVSAQGIGVEWSRPFNGEQNCARTTVRYLIWEGEGTGQNTEYCYCSDPETDYRQDCS